MRFACKTCGLPANISVGVLLADATCPNCARPLDLSPEERTFRGYELQEKIGSGGFGSVWKVRKKDADHHFALKLIPKQSVSDDERIHLLREVRSSRHLKHPDVVPALEFGEDGEYWFLVSDYVDGTPLGKWARDRQPAPNQAAELCAAVADAIHYVHSQGFIHRDLKPGNIIVDHANHPHIIDFGLCKCEKDAELNAIERYRKARELMSQRRAGGDRSILGTPAYTSPEQASGDALGSSPQSDIYSLGVILYELLTGSRPFRGTGRKLIRQILAGRPRRPSRIRKEISREFDAICLKAISRKAAERYATAADFAADCRNAVAGKPIKASVGRRLLWR